MAYPFPVENAPLLRDGDGGFVRLNARNNPALLQPGEVQVAENLRFDRGVAQVRKGKARRGDTITGTEVLTLPFDLAPDITILSIDRTGTTATVTTDGDHGVQVGQLVNHRNTGVNAYDGDHYVTSTPTSDTYTFAVTGAPGNVTTGVLNAGPVLGTGPLESEIRAAARYVNALAAGKPEYIVLAAAERSYHYQPDAPGVPLIEYPAGQTIDESDDVSLVQVLDRMYLFRAPREEGVYAPFRIESLTRSGDVATAVAHGHWVEVGMRIRITGADQAGWSHEFDVTGVTADEIFFEVLHEPTTPATYQAAIMAQVVKPPMYWDGVSTTWQVAPGGSHPAGPTYSRMPGNCVVTTYTGNVLGIARSKDEWWKSRPLDPDTYDPFGKSFRTGAGGSDYIVAGQAYADGDEIVLCRYSLWLCHIEMDDTGTQIDPSRSYIRELTREVGCRSRQSVAMVRNYVYFLSDVGVYRVDPNFTEQRLVELTLLLSDPVKPITDRIEWSVADKASAAFYDSRYWLLVQRDDQAKPNMLLVYSLLSDGWESVDLFDDLDGVALVTARAGNRERMFCASTNAGVLYLLDERTDGDEPAEGEEIADIVAPLTSRRYFGLTHEPKRVLRMEGRAVLAPGGSIQVTTQLIDPDTSVAAEPITNETAGREDYVVKLPVRMRAHAAECTVTLTKPGTQLRSLALEAASLDPAARTVTEN